MKTLSTGILAPINAEQMNKLTTIVNETIAQGCYQPAPKTFTTVDMWNIQRQAKGRVQRRYSL